MTLSSESSPSMAYSPNIQELRSIILQRSEQKGLYLFPSQITSILQIGHLTFILLNLVTSPSQSSKFLYRSENLIALHKDFAYYSKG